MKITRALKAELDLAFERMNDDDIKLILNHRVHQVRWLYNNSNKCTTVYDERMIRFIIQRLQSKIKSLERQIRNPFPVAK